MRIMTKETRTSRRAVRRLGLRRYEKPKLIAYALRKVAETCGCAHYFENTCGLNHSRSDGGRCGSSISATCGVNRN